MKGRSTTLRLIALTAALTVALIPGGSSSQPTGPRNNVLARALAVERGVAAHGVQSGGKPFPIAPLSGGVMQQLTEAFPMAGSQAPSAGPGAALLSGGGIPSGESLGCRKVRPGGGSGRDSAGVNLATPDNIRVNQDCTLRRQAEEWVGVNPRAPSNVLGGQNDNVVGFNHCGYDWSLMRGRRWGSVGTQPPPFYQELFPTGDTADACSDPAGAFDHLGNAYVTGVFFDVADIESAIWVAKSSWPIKGRFYHIPDDTAAFQHYRTDVMGEPANSADENIFHDKELMVADSRPDSPKKGNVYITWTRFEVNETEVGGRSPIVFSQSTDGGATWSDQVIISGSSEEFCTDFSGTPGDPNACDQDQGSHPVVGKDGTIYVTFGNGNTPELGINQVLFVRCPPTEDCVDESDWEGPFRVGDLIGTHPIGDPGNPGGCPVGRQCLPPNGYRVPEFTSISVSVDREDRLYAVWADHRNGDDSGSDCGLQPWTTATPPCNHDVFYAFSTDRGTTWSATRNVTAAFGQTAQWQPWHDVLGDGSKLKVAFYDRHYGNCEFTGCNNITLATISQPASGSPSISYRRITTSSMPNLIPANNPIQAGFLGDYMWVEVSRHRFDQRVTHIVWADTRPLFGSAPEEDVYYARVR
jgi:hypothetical protein